MDLKTLGKTLGLEVIKQRNFGNKRLFLVKNIQMFSVLYFINEEIENSICFFTYIDALHYFNKAKKEIE